MEPVSGTYPEKYIADIVEEFQKKGSVEKMDSITGATRSTNSFKALLSEALAKAKKGETISAAEESSSK
jgi:major membrane immunogen (membrane-anchored lipoprotein)